MVPTLMRDQYKLDDGTFCQNSYLRKLISQFGSIETSVKRKRLIILCTNTAEVHMRQVSQSLDFLISLTPSEIPWRFITILPNVKISLTFSKFPDNSLTLRNFISPWHFPDGYEPCVCFVLTLKILVAGGLRYHDAHMIHSNDLRLQSKHRSIP